MVVEKTLEEFKRKHEDKLRLAYTQNLLEAVLSELKRAYDDWRAVRKWMAIANETRRLYEEILSKHYKEGIDETLNEIGKIGLYFKYSDLRGLHRKRELPQRRLSEEYNELHKSLKEKIKRRYRNPLVAKKKHLESALGMTLNLDNPHLTNHIKQWIDRDLHLSEIAWSALGLKYGVSASKIKKDLNKKALKRKKS